MISNELKNKIDNLSAVEKDDVYRYLWSKHVKEDVESLCEDMDIVLTEDQTEIIVERYVYNGDYDCNLPYWTNIENLIRECKE